MSVNDELKEVHSLTDEKLEDEEDKARRSALKNASSRLHSLDPTDSPDEDKFRLVLSDAKEYLNHLPSSKINGDIREVKSKYTEVLNEL